MLSLFAVQNSDLDFTPTYYLMPDMAPNFKNAFEKLTNSNCQWLWLWCAYYGKEVVTKIINEKILFIKQSQSLLSKL